MQAHPLKASAVEPELFAPEELLEPKQDRLLEPSPRAESDPGMANGPSSSGQAGHKWFANWFGKDHDSSHDISAESPLRQPPFVSAQHLAQCWILAAWHAESCPKRSSRWSVAPHVNRCRQIAMECLGMFI